MPRRPWTAPTTIPGAGRGLSFINTYTAGLLCTPSVDKIEVRTDDLQPLSTWLMGSGRYLTSDMPREGLHESTRPSDGRLTHGGWLHRKLTCFISGGNHGSCAWILVKASQAKHHKLGCLRYGRLSSRRRSLCDAMLRPCDAACTVGAQSAERSTTSAVRLTSMPPSYQE